MEYVSRPVKWMCGQFTDLDADVLGIVNEKSKAQQAFEALALLIMLREWLMAVCDARCTIRVRGDNLAALSLLAKMQPKSPSPALVAREIAIIIARGSFPPNFAQHIPGVSNTLADSQSRRYETATIFINYGLWL